MNLVLAVLTLLSFALTLWRWVVSIRFPLHARGPEPAAPLPGITLLKPLKGADSNTRKCLESWLSQEYSGPVQILFGVLRYDDPVCDIVRGLFKEFPNINAKLVICSQALALNGKVSTLIQLEPMIAHDYVVISDADVSVPRDFLTRTAPMLTQPGVGLVNCFYRLANPSTLPMRWEAVGVNADFWSQVLQARSLKEVDFALGAVMALPCSTLKKIGGLAALADYLADDFHMGQQVSKTGGRIVFANCVVDCWESSLTWKQAWTHQLRWARTIRFCQPVPVFFSILSNATLWPVLWILSSGAIKTAPEILWPICGISLGFRTFTALDQQRRITQSTDSLAYWWLVPVKDLLNAVIWTLSFIGNTIEWRGERFRVRTGGKLER